MIKKALLIASIVCLTSCKVTDVRPAIENNAAMKVQFDNLREGFLKTVELSNATEEVKSVYRAEIGANADIFKVHSDAQQRYLSSIGELNLDEVLNLTDQIYIRIKERE